MRYIVKTEDEWLNLRSQYVTASEAATLVGLNPYSSPTKLRQASVFKGNAFTTVGTMLEPIVVQVVNSVLNTSFKLFEQEFGGKVFYTKGSLGATPDAFYDDVLLECKTTRPHSFQKYSGFPNLVYLIQTQVQMYCADMSTAYLAILSTDLTQQTMELKWPISIYKVLKNDQVYDILQEEATRFLLNDTYRIKSPYKKLVRLLLSLCYERVY